MANKASWKNKKILPERLLIYLQSVSEIRGDDVVFVSTPDNFFLPEKNLIEEFLNFSHTDEKTAHQSIFTALKNCVKIDNMSPSFFLEQLNNELNKHRNKQSSKCLLTSLSLQNISNLKKVKIFESTINFYVKKFPSRYLKHRKNILNKFQSPEQEEYIKCIVTTNTFSSDINIHLTNLNILRAILCLAISDRFSIRMDGKANPLNEIRLGNFHTLHHVNGEPVHNFGWVETNFVLSEQPLYLPEEIDKKFINRFIKKLSLSNYSDVLKDTLLIYVKALDEPDHNVAITLLWNTIDKLLNRNKGSYHEISSRIKKLFGQDSRFIDVIEGIKFTRNTFVHDAISNQQAKFYCLSLRGLYRSILFFHLNAFPKDVSLDEALEVIDLLDKPKNAEHALKINKRLATNRNQRS